MTKQKKSILSKALDGLRSFNAIEGDDDYIVLTEAGKVYADKGERPDTYQKSFDIFVDSDHADWKTIKNALSTVNEHIKFINTKCEDLSLTIDEIKEYARCTGSRCTLSPRALFARKCRLERRT